MSRNNLNYLREDQFSELAKNGSAQDDYGITHEFAEGDLYVTEDDTGGTGSGGVLYEKTLYLEIVADISVADTLCIKFVDPYPNKYETEDDFLARFNGEYKGIAGLFTENYTDGAVYVEISLNRLYISGAVAGEEGDVVAVKKLFNKTGMWSVLSCKVLEIKSSPSDTIIIK